MGLTVHHLGHSQSDRVVWLCEELGVPYELKKYDRSPVLAPKDFKALHPIGSAPVIEDDPNVKLAETHACVEWICNMHANGKLLVKPGEKNYADYLFYYHISNGTLQPAVGRVMALRLAGMGEENATLKRYSAKIYQVMDLLEERLGSVPFLAGEQFTGECCGLIWMGCELIQSVIAADIMVIFSLTTMREVRELPRDDFQC